MKKDSDAVRSESEIAKRRDAALLRALSTPHKKQAEMKKGRASGGRRPAANEPESLNGSETSSNDAKLRQLLVGDFVVSLENPEAPRMLYRAGIWGSRTGRSDTT